jgi:hypothetical protein
MLSSPGTQGGKQAAAACDWNIDMETTNDTTAARAWERRKLKFMAVIRATRSNVAQVLICMMDDGR